ncbi:MAG: acylphosphatase [Thermodesulfobacteriota bacterium]
MNKVRAHIKIKGLVQGVFFRANTKKVARIHAVCGWVRNTPDGSVEAVLEGNSGAVNKVIEWCHKGPPGAVVKDVTVSWLDYNAEYTDFEVIF